MDEVQSNGITLMEHTRQLLRDSEKSLPAIYADLHADGVDISFAWLRKFSAGNLKDPSVNRVEALYQHLTGKPLLKVIV